MGDAWAAYYAFELQQGTEAEQADVLDRFVFVVGGVSFGFGVVDVGLCFSLPVGRFEVHVFVWLCFCGTPNTGYVWVLFCGGT